MKRFLPALVAFAVLAGGCAEPEPQKDGKDVKDGKNPVVVMKVKDHGTVKIELFADKAPITVKNFLKYVDDGHYDGTVFHRVMPNFMIQGGHFTKGFAKARSHQEGEKLGKKTHGEIKNESSNGLLNKRGTLAMARTPLPDSASDQFFISLKHNDFLDKENAEDGVGYAVFAKVVDGMDVVDKIAQVKTMRKSPAGHEAVPADDVIIESIRRVESE